MQEVKAEYWELIRELNRGNKLKNEKTEIIFEVVKTTNRTLFARMEKNKLLLCQETQKNYWLADIPKYSNLAQIIIKSILIELMPEETKEITSLVKSIVFKKTE